ncbi:IQ-domain 30 [Striga asiatica]|uniref:IQ-domain 30 n=1 Tax=Striga asiatica TaxID=4170 RepID=A0A5A7PDH0_STRAF|nr:IQ-domain 30 [Striga asiatica]
MILSRNTLNTASWHTLNSSTTTSRHVAWRWVQHGGGHGWDWPNTLSHRLNRAAHGLVIRLRVGLPGKSPTHAARGPPVHLGRQIVAIGSREWLAAHLVPWGCDGAVRGSRWLERHLNGSICSCNEMRMLGSDGLTQKGSLRGGRLLYLNAASKETKKLASPDVYARQVPSNNLEKPAKLLDDYYSVQTMGSEQEEPEYQPSFVFPNWNCSAFGEGVPLGDSPEIALRAPPSLTAVKTFRLLGLALDGTFPKVERKTADQKSSWALLP